MIVQPQAGTLGTVGAPAATPAPAPAATPAVDPNLPADLRAQAAAPATQPSPSDVDRGSLPSADIQTGGVQVAPTPGATDAASAAVARGLLGSRETDPLTGLPSIPQPTLIDTSKVPHTAADLATPESFQKPIDDLSKEAHSSPGELAGQDAANLQAWAERRDSLKAEFEARKGTLQWGEVAETFGRALSRLGAGLYGMRTGLDLSGAKFDSTDWTKRYDQSFDEYRTELNDAEKQAHERGEVIQRLRGEYENWRGGLRSAQEAKARADLEVQTENRRIGTENSRFKFEADKFNAEQTNALKKDVFNKEVAEEVAKIRSRRDLSPKDKELMTVAAKEFEPAHNRWMDEYKETTNSLTRLETLDTGHMTAKEHGAVRDAAYAKLSAGVNPEVLAAAKKKAHENSGWWPGAGDYDTQLVKEIRAYGQKAYTDEPRYTDYLKKYNVDLGVPAAPGGGTPGPGGTIRVRNTKTGQTGTIPSANLESARTQGFEVIQ